MNIMDSRNKENLKELLEKFVDPEQAEKQAEDIRRAEQILYKYPPPEPDENLLADIKAKITETLRHKRIDIHTRMAYKAVAAAAAMVLLAGISIKLFEKNASKTNKPAVSIISDAIWESNNLVADDVELAVLFAEIEQAEREIISLRLGENAGNGGEAVSELEIELIEINSNFWKG